MEKTKKKEKKGKEKAENNPVIIVVRLLILCHGWNGVLLWVLRGRKERN